MRLDNISTRRKNVPFLKKRFKALTNNHLFQGMEFRGDSEKMKMVA